MEKPVNAKTNKELLEIALRALNAACNENEDINQSAEVGQAIEALRKIAL